MDPGTGAVYLYQTQDKSWLNVTAIDTLRKIAYQSDQVKPYGGVQYGEIAGRVTCTMSVLVRRTENEWKWHQVSNTLFLDEYINPDIPFHKKRGMMMLAKATEAGLLRRVAPECAGLYLYDELEDMPVKAPVAPKPSTTIPHITSSPRVSRSGAARAQSLIDQIEAQQEAPNAQ